MTDSQNQDTSQGQIISKISRGIGWNYLTFGLSKSINLITVSVLAHVFSPDIIGIAVLATLAIDYIAILNNLGLGAAIIQRKDRSDEVSSTAFTLNLIIGLTLTLITSLFAASIAGSLFKEPMVGSVLRVLGAVFTINALGSVHTVLIQKDLDFRKRFAVETGNSLVKAAVSISLAYTGFGVWALIYGQLAGSMTALILLWTVNRWRPKLRLDWEIAKSLFRYGRSIMGVNALSVLQDNFDYLVIGALYSTAALGIYTYAYRLPELLVINVLWVMTSVLFPAFSSIQDNRDALKSSFLSIVRIVGLVVTPICFGLFIAAEPIVLVLFGEQWTGTIPILRILSASAWIHSLGFHAGDIYKAIGRPDLLIKTVVPIFLIRVALLWLGAQYGLLWVGAAHLITGLISLTIRQILMSRILDISFFEVLGQLTALKGGLALAALTVPCVMLSAGLPEPVRLALVVAVGGLGYLLVTWRTERELSQKLLRKLGLAKHQSTKGEVGAI